MNLYIKKLSPALLFLASGAIVAKEAGDKGQAKKRPTIWQQQMNMMRRMEKTFAELWADVDENDEEVRREGDVVKLPDIAIEKSKDEAALSLALKGIKAKKENISLDYDEDRGFAQAVIKDGDATTTLKVYPRGIALAVEKKITEEKKDESGKVLGKSSYVGYNSYSQYFPFVVDPSSITGEFKDGVLKLGLEKRQSKRRVDIK